MPLRIVFINLSSGVLNMSKITSVLLMSVVALGLSACGSNPPKEDPKAKMADCTFPSSPNDPAPDWVCTGSAEGVEVSAMGSEKIVAGDTDFAQTMAVASARSKLASQMKVQVAGMVKKYMETTGAAGSATVDKVNTSVTKQITNETLVGSRLFKSKTSPDGTVYVLVGLDEKSVQKVTEAAVKTSMNNDQALWQQFKASKAQDELAADIAKQKP